MLSTSHVPRSQLLIATGHETGPGRSQSSLLGHETGAWPLAKLAPRLLQSFTVRRHLLRLTLSIQGTISTIGEIVSHAALRRFLHVPKIATKITTSWTK